MGKSASLLKLKSNLHSPSLPFSFSQKNPFNIGSGGAHSLYFLAPSGDIAFRCLDHLNSLSPPDSFPSSYHVTILDINAAMLKVGQDRAMNLGYQNCKGEKKMPLPFFFFEEQTQLS